VPEVLLFNKLVYQSSHNVLRLVAVSFIFSQHHYVDTSLCIKNMFHIMYVDMLMISCAA
jgi:hypothetical protein